MITPWAFILGMFVTGCLFVAACLLVCIIPWNELPGKDLQTLDIIVLILAYTLILSLLIWWW